MSHLVENTETMGCKGRKMLENRTVDALLLTNMCAQKSAQLAVAGPGGSIEKSLASACHL